ncbi:MAG: amidohydrolase family protein [Armatimonadota bacterium]|nr:amidohydrolase family protein [Armatimonadota bacterium]
MCYNFTMATLRYPKVDFHVHAFPDELAQRALNHLVETYHVPAITDGTVSGLLKHMKSCGVSYSVIQPVATKPSQVKSINEWASSRKEPGIISFGAIHPDCENVAEEIDRIISLGLPGIKIQANWQGVYVDDARMYPIYEAAQRRLIIMFHAGKELAPTDEIRATPERLARVLRDFPHLTMIAAHMGGYLMWNEVEEHLLTKDVYFDTSACFCSDLPDARFLQLIRRHGAERVLFATDSPFGNAKNDIHRLLSLGLDDEELELIFWGNAKRLLGAHLETRQPAL